MQIATGDPPADRLSYPDTLAVVVEEFARVLGVDPGERGNFFELGGDSLRGALAVVEIGRRLGVSLTLQDLFEYAVASELAVAARQAPWAVERPAERTASTEELPISYMQQNRFLRVTRAMRQGKPPFQVLVPFGIAIRGALSDADIERALGKVVACHEALRTGFRLDTETDRVTPFVVPATEASLVLERRSHRDVPADRWASVCDADLSQLSGCPMDLTAPPLLRARLCRFSEDHAVLLLAAEHQIFDGRSEGIFRSELAMALRRPDEDLPAPVQYLDWIRGQHRFLDSPAAGRALGHWRHALSGTRPYPDLDLPVPVAPAEDSYAVLCDVLAAESLASLRRSVGTANATPFVAFLTAAAVSWQRISDHPDAIIHFPCENRQADGAERVIGWLAHSLILRARLGGVRTWREALRLVRDAVVASFEHQAMPFAKVIQALQPGMHGTATRQARLFATYEAAEENVDRVPGGDLRPLPRSEQTRFADAGVTFSASETAAGLRLATIWDPRAVDRDHIKRLHQGVVSGMLQMSHQLTAPIES